jgi:hypothetical protein
VSDPIARDVRWLKRYAVVSSLLMILFGISAFRQQPARARFEVLEVERLNVVTKDGKLAVVVSNAERMPGNVVGGKEHAFNGSRGNGMMFYNRDGDEAGALIMDNEHRDTSITAWGQLSIDRYGSDQVAALRYVEEPSGWVAGLEVAHYPRGVLFEWHAARDSLLQLPPAQRDSGIQQLRRRFIREGKFEIKRLFAGEIGRDAVVRLNDTRGRTRIRMIVDSLDMARLEFLDARGTVVQRLPN